MNNRCWKLAALALGAALLPGIAQAEILGMLNYETAPPESLKALKKPLAEQERREGIAIIDLDPQSERYGEIVHDIPLPPDLVAHHIFYNRNATKAYVTALGKGELRVMDMTEEPLQMKTIEIPECQVGEDVIFSEDDARWFLTCMGSDKVIVGDVASDEVTDVIETPEPYPHGIAIHDGIDRLLVTSTVRPADLKDPGDTVTSFVASSGEALDSHDVSNGGEGAAPVEILFVPGAEPPVAYITNMYGGTLSAAQWNPDEETFGVQPVFNFAEHDAGVPLEMYFTQGGKRLYVTTAKPGALHIFSLEGGPMQPELLKTLPAGEGAHHVAFTKDGKYAYVQNSLLNLPGMSEGTITVVDLEQEEVVDTVDTFKQQGLNPNSIVLLPEWNDPAGH